MSETRPELSKAARVVLGCLGSLISYVIAGIVLVFFFTIVVGIMVWLRGVYDTFGALPFITVAAGFGSAFFLLTIVDPVGQIVFSTFFAVFLGSLPHTLFLIAFNTSPDPNRLKPLAAWYEQHAVELHLFLKRFVDIDWYWWMPIFVILAWITLWTKFNRLLGRVLAVKRTAEFVSLVLAVASSITLFSQTPGGSWSPDIEARIRAEIDAQVPTRVNLNFERALRVHLQSDQTWVVSLTSLNAVARAWQAGPTAGNALYDEPGADRATAHGMERALAERLASRVEEKFADAVREISPPKPLPPTLATLHTLSSERDKFAKAEQQEREAISDTVANALLSRVPRDSLILDIGGDFASSLLSFVSEKVLDYLGAHGKLNLVFGAQLEPIWAKAIAKFSWSRNMRIYSSVNEFDAGVAQKIIDIKESRAYDNHLHEAMDKFIKEMEPYIRRDADEKR